MRRTVVACGALAAHIHAIAARRGWDVEVHALPPELHNRPERIPAAVEEKVAQSHKRLAPASEVAAAATGEARELVAQSHEVVVAYGDCGTHGALDGFRRLPVDTCYDLFARDEVRELLAEEPGTYFLTDFLVRSFDRTVVRSLGLDRYPDLREDLFRHYTRVVWLAQRPTPELRAQAERCAGILGLPLTTREVGDGGLERALEELLC